MSDPFYYHTKVDFKVLIETKKAFRIQIKKVYSMSFLNMIQYYEDVCRPLEIWIPKKWLRENYIWTKGLFMNVEKILQKRRDNKIKGESAAYEMEQIISIP
tara:strand:+ start:1147 stop:1449 length:303 start_codon:yes stop_codon:yes gene_type:complete